MDAMYWEHPIALDKIRRLIGWRQMTGGRGRRGSGPGGPGGGAGARGAPGAPAGPGGFGRGAAAHWMGPLFGGMRGGPGFGRRRRASRGDVRTGALLLLAEEPRNGYQIMQELEERSEGLWRPSPGSVYPALQQLEDEGLIRSEESDGRRLYHLTDAGRAYVDERPDDQPAPWQTFSDSMSDQHAETAALARDVAMAFVQVLRAGSEAQVAEAGRVLTETRRSLYRILADGDPAGEDAECRRPEPPARARRARRRCPSAACRSATARSRRSRGSTSTSSPGRRSGSSAPTAPASRRRSGCCARSSSRPAAGRPSPATTWRASATTCAATSASSSRTPRSTATSARRRTCACTPSSTASRARSSPTGCARSWRWSACGSGATRSCARSAAA